MPPDVEICAVRLPGREARLAEPFCTSIASAVRTLAGEVDGCMEGGTVLFGHSLGALIAFELARERQRRGLRDPDLLIVSGCRAPQLVAEVEPMRDLSSAEFLERVRRFEGLPDAVFDHPDLLELVLPILRADISMFETYSFEPGNQLRCPIVALAGTNDEKVPVAGVDAWREHTGHFSLHRIPGGHFFLQTAAGMVLDIVSREIVRIRGRAGFNRERSQAIS